MTGPFFSKGPCKTTNPNATTGDVTEWITSLQNAFLACNWTTVSTFVGSGGTLGINMRTYPTPNGQTAVLKVFFDGSGEPFGDGPIITFQMADSTQANNTTIGIVSLTTGKPFTLICGPHQFFLWSLATSPAFRHNYVMGGVPRTLGSAECYWGIGDAGTFGGAPSFTNSLSGTAGGGSWSYLLNGTLTTRATDPTLFLLLVPNRSHNFLSDLTAFEDTTVPVIEPILVLRASIAVYLWDSVVISARFSTNLGFKMFTRNFQVITLGYSFGALAVVSNDSNKVTGEVGYAY